MVKKKILIEIEYLDFKDLQKKLNEIPNLAWGRNQFDDKGIMFQKLHLTNGREEMINGNKCLVYPSKMNFDEIR